jgi:ATP-dependent Lon protease
MLDEIDKLGYSYQGDPGSALLEVLDSEQNSEFRDHYLDIPFDLSNVLFITTANTLDTIPAVLLDRMEIVEMSGYITEEKIEIAKRYLLPKQLKRHGLNKNHVALDKSGHAYIIEGWARESGVRNLERQIEKICRKTAAKVASEEHIPDSLLNKQIIYEYLGPEIHTDPLLLNDNIPGIARGLAWTPLGGTITTIESLVISSKEPGLKITGQLGDVMTESVNIAHSYIRNLLRSNKIASEILSKDLIHIHVPSGATPKDGPSAGITMACSIYSLVTGKKIKKNIAMTGELSLTGAVLPVGGIKEKIIAARRANMRTVIMPAENKSDLEKIPANIRKGIEFKLVCDMEEVILIAF